MLKHYLSPDDLLKLAKLSSACNAVYKDYGWSHVGVVADKADVRQIFDKSCRFIPWRAFVNPSLFKWFPADKVKKISIFFFPDNCSIKPFNALCSLKAIYPRLDQVVLYVQESDCFESLNQPSNYSTVIYRNYGLVFIRKSNAHPYRDWTITIGKDIDFSKVSSMSIRSGNFSILRALPRMHTIFLDNITNLSAPRSTGKSVKVFCSPRYRGGLTPYIKACNDISKKSEIECLIWTHISTKSWKHFQDLSPSIENILLNLILVEDEFTWKPPQGIFDEVISVPQVTSLIASRHFPTDDILQNRRELCLLFGESYKYMARAEFPNLRHADLLQYSFGNGRTLTIPPENSPLLVSLSVSISKLDVFLQFANTLPYYTNLKRLVVWNSHHSKARDNDLLRATQKAVNTRMDSLFSFMKRKLDLEYEDCLETPASFRHSIVHFLGWKTHLDPAASSFVRDVLCNPKQMLQRFAESPFFNPYERSLCESPLIKGVKIGDWKRALHTIPRISLENLPGLTHLPTCHLRASRSRRFLESFRLYEYKHRENWIPYLKAPEACVDQVIFESLVEPLCKLKNFEYLSLGDLHVSLESPSLQLLAHHSDSKLKTINFFVTKKLIGSLPWRNMEPVYDTTLSQTTDPLLRHFTTKSYMPIYLHFGMSGARVSFGFKAQYKVDLDAYKMGYSSDAYSEGSAQGYALSRFDKGLNINRPGTLMTSDDRVEEEEYFGEMSLFKNRFLEINY